MSRPTSTLTDDKLIALVTTKGSTEHFGILYDRYANKVYRKCLSFVKNEEQAQDMVQEIFLKVFYQLSKFKGNSRFSTWLYAITYNYCVEQYRKLHKVKKVDIDDRLDVPDDDDEKELLSIRAEHLKKALDMISPEDKMILLMKYQDDTPIKEIMATLEISESAVKMRLARARKRVREIVKEMEAIL